MTMTAVMERMTKKEPVAGPGPRIGRRVREQRNRLGWSQEQLRIQARFEDRSWIASLETGQIGEPSADKLLAVARAMGVPVEYLISGAWPQEMVKLPRPEAEVAERIARRFGARGLRLAERLVLEVFTDIDETAERDAERKARPRRDAQSDQEPAGDDPLGAE